MTAVNLTSNTGNKKVLLWPPKLTQLSQIDQVRAKTRKKTTKIGIVRARHAIKRNLYAINIIKKLFYQILPGIFKKLVSVSTNFLSITETNKEDEIVLKKIPYIHYLLCFCKDKKNKMQALNNSVSETNAMILAYILELGFKVHQTNVKA